MEQDWELHRAQAELAEVRAAILGRKITGVQISDSTDSSTDDLVLLTNRGSVWYTFSDGQCCPSTIQSITGVRALLDGGPVVDVDIAREDLSGDNGYWCDRTRVEFITEDSAHAQQRTVVTVDNSCLGVMVRGLDSREHEAAFATRRFVEVTDDYHETPWREA